jgi:hypothetical protein
VPWRLGSSFIFHGAVSARYLFAAATAFMASPIPARTLLAPIRSPTVSNAAFVVASSSRSTSSSSPGSGTAPKFFAAMAIERFTRLPQPATSSSLLRRRNSAHVKSESWFSGPAAQM